MARPALSADRATLVLDLLVSHPTERFTLAEIQRRTGVNPASAHALMTVLARRGYVLRHPTAKTYSLGPALMAAGLVAAEQQPALLEGQRAVELLGRELELEVVLTAATETEIIIVARSSGRFGFGQMLQVGQRLPLRPPLGTIFLAWAPDATVEAWLDRARPVLNGTEREAQRRAMQAVRARGFAVGLDSAKRLDLARVVAEVADSTSPVTAELLERVVAELNEMPYHLEEIKAQDTYDVGPVAAAIFDANGQVAAALTVNGLQPHVSGEELARIAQRIRAEAIRITKEIHGAPPPGLR